MDIKPGGYLELHRGIEGSMELGEREAELTKQLLDFPGLRKLQTKPLDLNEVLRKTSEMFGRTHKNVVIHAQYAPGVQTVEADRTQIEQVILNLLVNAGQAMPDGGDVTLRTEEVVLSAAELAAYGLSPGRYIKLSIADTGVGMDAETRERIFDSFFATDAAGHGTGLGLASVLGIVRNHGGLITVVSEPCEGATFLIYLPVSSRPIIEEQPPLSVAPRCGSETILVVDDEEHIVKTSKLLLEAMGYEVLTARSGIEAVEVYRQRQEQVSLVILDMTMPGMSGGETFDALREVSSSVKVLLASGYSADGDASVIIERGCDGFIQKPFNMAALSSKLKELL
jgi:CheY-like chemotaxis protein